MWWFILGFIVGGVVTAEVGARYIVRKLKDMGLIQPDDEVRPFDSGQRRLREQRSQGTVFDQSQEWEWPL